jgi:predicted small lipoprotein YifL
MTEAPVPSDNTTLTAVLAAYQDDGYCEELTVDGEGRLACATCGNRTAPEDIELHSLRRLEGASDPDDMVAVLAVACTSCGAKGTLVLPFGPHASEVESEFLLRISDAREAHTEVPSAGPSAEGA